MCIPLVEWYIWQFASWLKLCGCCLTAPWFKLLLIAVNWMVSYLNNLCLLWFFSSLLTILKFIQLLSRNAELELKSSNAMNPFQLMMSQNSLICSRFQNLGEMMTLGRYDGAISPSFIEGLTLEGPVGHSGN